MSPSRTTLLRRLAGAVGIDRSYRSIGGGQVAATNGALEGVLGALGYRTESIADLTDALEERRRHAARPLAPVTVIRTGTHESVEIAPASTASVRKATLHLRDETGGERSIPLRKLPVSDGTGGGIRSIDLASLDLDVGYYSLTLELDGVNTHSHLLVRPGRARLPRRAFGVFAPVYGLRSASDWGIGSTTELGELGRWAKGQGASFVGTLPIYPAFYESHFEVSPYRPVSRVAWNEIFLDVTALPELAVSPDAAALLSSARTRRSVQSLRSKATVDYAKVFAVKKAVIAACAVAVAHGPRKAAFETFLSHHPEVKAYALYRADRDGGGPDEQWASVQYYQYGQFALDAALGEMVADDGLPLYLDLPLGVHPDGFDPAHYPTAFISGASIGAPPDDFFVGGQNWGIPPLHPEGLRDGEFGYITATFRHLFRHAAVVRIDHVMGLERCFVIPDGASGSDGAYLRYPSSELRAVAAIEAARAGVTLVGEDLGTVPPETRAAMRRDGMLHSAVFEMEGSSAHPSPATRPASMASFATHDLPRFAEYIAAGEVPGRVADGALSRGEASATRAERKALRERLIAHGDGERGAARAYRGVLSWLGTTRASLAIVDVGDLVLDPEPENRPGPDSGRTSWRHRLPVTVEALATDPSVAARIAIVATGRPRKNGRRR